MKTSTYATEAELKSYIDDEMEADYTDHAPCKSKTCLKCIPEDKDDKPFKEHKTGKQVRKTATGISKAINETHKYYQTVLDSFDPMNDDEERVYQYDRIRQAYDDAIRQLVSQTHVL